MTSLLHDLYSFSSFCIAVLWSTCDTVSWYELRKLQWSWWNCASLHEQSCSPLPDSSWCPLSSSLMVPSVNFAAYSDRRKQQTAPYMAGVVFSKPSVSIFWLIFFHVTPAFLLTASEAAPSMSCRRIKPNRSYRLHVFMLNPLPWRSWAAASS